MPRLLEVVGSSSTFEDVDGLGLLGLRAYGISRSSSALKRAMDVLVAALALVLFALSSHCYYTRLPSSRLTKRHY